MSDEAKLLEDVRRASIETIVQHLRAMHELNEATADVRPAGHNPAGVAGAASDYVLGLARLFLSNYNTLLRFQSRHFDYVADRVREFAKLYRAPDAGDVSEATLPLRGALGEKISAGFTLENLRTATADVSFCTSEFRTADGQHRVAAPVTITPRGGAPRRAGSDRHVEPGARRTFDLSVSLDPKLFRAGARYFADTVVLDEGRAAARLALSLEVAPEARPRARARRRARKGGRGKP